VTTSARLTRLLLALLAAAMLLGGCATAARPDPLESVNRRIFAFNDAVDDAVIRPAAEVYQAVLPRPVRVGLTNFFGNVRDAWSAFNLVLQGRIGDAAKDVLRFSTNTVFGIYGFVDIASELGLERHGEDFGQTLGRWGFPAGAYIVWPILGSSTVRDSIGLPIDVMAAPDPFVSGVALRNTLTVTRVVSTRANLLNATQVLDDIALDRYSFVRDAYLQRRRSLIYNGEPPDAGEVRYDLPEADAPGVAPAGAAASAPAAAAQPQAVEPAASAPAPAPVPVQQPASSPASGS
jgi:phospholipid-binding lipoprotein MlaA